MLKFIVIGLIGLVVGLFIGIFIGRALLEREWSTPKVLQRLSAADAGRSSGKGADPAPKEGTLVMGGAPLARARQVMAELTSKDPVVLKVGAVGNVDEGVELHLVLKNRGKCKVTAFSGVAYGYDAYGRAVKMNQGGEHYVAFAEDKVEDLDVGKAHMHAAMLHNVDTASLALAQVDQVTCANGEKWARN
jgi:hypothetical protein